MDVEGINVRLLMYADDIVILSEHQNVLQKMIHNLEKFTKIWNLEINMSKSKIMVFRNGGRLAGAEKWKCMGEEIEIVSEYTYLGVILTPKMSFTRHVEHRNTMAKNSINATWNNFFE